VQTVSGRKIDTERNITLGKPEGVLGEDECATTQTVHLAASVVLEWWCAANDIADQKDSKRHKYAICFEIDLMTTTPLDK